MAVGRVAKEKAAADGVWGGLQKGDACVDQAAVFLAGNFSLIRADLPLRSRK
jgi:hypothetical protein